MFLILLKLSSALLFFVCTHLISECLGPEVLARFAIISVFSIVFGCVFGLGSGPYIFSYSEKLFGAERVIFFSKVIRQAWLCAALFGIGSYVFGIKDGVVVSIAALQYALCDLYIWKSRLEPPGVARVCSLAWISLAGYFLITLALLSSIQLEIEVIYMASFAISCFPSIYYLVKGIPISESFYFSRQEFRSRFNITFANLLGTVYISVPVILAVVMSIEDLDPFAYLLLRLKGYLLITIYILEVFQLKAYRDWVITDKIVDFNKIYRWNGFLYTIIMLLGSLALYFFGKNLVGYIYPGSSNYFILHLIFYMVAFSVFGLINVPATLLTASGHSERVSSMYIRFFFPVLIIEAAILEFSPNLIVVVDMLLYLMIFIFLRRWSHLAFGRIRF